MEATNEEELKKLDERLADGENRKQVGDFGCVESSSELPGDKIRFLFLRHVSRLHEMNLETILTSPKARTQKDTRARITYGHH